MLHLRTQRYSPWYFCGEESMTKGKPWSVEEEKQLREMVQEHKRLNEIAGFFGKSPASIKMKISRLKLVVVVRQIQHITTSNKQRKKRIFFCSCLTRGLCPRVHCNLMITSRNRSGHYQLARGLRLRLVVVDQSQTARTTTTCVALASRPSYPLRVLVQ